MPKSENKQKRKDVVKYIFLGLTVATYGFIFYQSALKPNNSKGWNNWANNFWAGLINDVFGIKEDVVITKPEKITFNTKELLSGDLYQTNDISGYDQFEIPLSGEKFLIADVSPFNTTDKSVTFVASPSEKVNLIQSGNCVEIEALELGDVSIKAICNADNSITADYNFSIVDRRAPTHCYLTLDDKVNLGESIYLFNIIPDYHLYPLEDEYYYDSSKYTITSTNESVGVVRGEYFKAVGVGKTTVGVLYANSSWEYIEITVVDKGNTISNVIGMNIEGENSVYVGDVHYGKCVKLHPVFETNDGEAPTDKNVIWSVDNPVAAYVSQDGYVWGNKHISDDDVAFTVRATSVDNPTVYKDFPMTLKNIKPNGYKTNSNMRIDNNGYIAYIGQSSYVQLEFEPRNNGKVDIEATIEDPSIIKAEVVGDRINFIGLEEGTTKITINVKDNPEIESFSFNVRVETRGYINESNTESFSRIVRKYISGHAFLFMVGAIFMSVYVTLAHKDKNRKTRLLALASVLVFGFFMGMFSEFIETLVPGRSPSFIDAFIDLIGTAIGLFFVFIYVGIKEYRLYKKEKQIIDNEENQNPIETKVKNK